MSKKKESTLKSWGEVDAQLKKLGELQIQKSKLEGNLTIKVNKLKEEFSEKCGIINTEIKEIEKDITRYCEENKECFINKRNKKLNFGIVAYRITEKVLIKNVQAVISSLKNLCLENCLRIKEEIDKEKIKGLDANILTKIGVSVVKEDKLSIEPDIVEITANLKQ